MKLRPCLFLAAISVLLGVGPARTARRPRYGGTLRWDIAASLNSPDFDAAAAAQAGPAAIELRKLLGSPEGPNASSQAPGSAAFRVAQWQAGKWARLSANEEYAAGRPFVDSIEIQMGRGTKERLLDLELGKADLAEIPAEEARRAAAGGVRLSSSPPDELIALVFVAGQPLAEEVRAREALARAIDRASIANFILQKEGQAAGGLLPQWSSGTEFLFATAQDPPGAKEQWSQIAGSPRISVGYDAGDALEQAIAERIAVNAHEAGIPVADIALSGFSPASPKAVARLLRLRMGSPQPAEALAEFLERLGPLPGIAGVALPDQASPQQIYASERALLGSRRVIPLVWLPQVYALSNRVRNWKAPGPGESWPLTDVWLDDSAGPVK